MSTIADKLQDLIEAKADMKSAIESKGVTPTGGLSTYADAIGQIPSTDSKSYIGISFENSTGMERTGVFDSSAITSMNSLYSGLYKLKIAELIDTGNVTDMNCMFRGCRALEVVPKYNTSNVTDMSYMFGGCYNLSTVPLFDTSNVTNMSHMFDTGEYFYEEYTPYMLSSVPQFNTSNVTDMSYMFRGCYNFSTVPLFDTSNVTNMSHMFDMSHISESINKSISSVPQFNTSNVTDMSYMFTRCINLTAIPAINTSNVTNMECMFENCINLTTLPELDCSNVTNIHGIVYIANSEKSGSLINLGGFKNLGKQESLNTPLAIYSTISRQSMLNIVNGLYDRATAGYKSLYISIPHISELLTDDEIAIATNKGWAVYG